MIKPIPDDRQKCSKCLERKPPQAFTKFNPMCNLCKARSDARQDPVLTAKRRRIEERREAKQNDFSLGAIDI